MDLQPENTPAALPVNEEVEGLPVAPEPRFPFWTYGDLAAALALAIPCFAAAGVLTFGFFHLTGWRPPTEAFRLLPAQFIGYGLWFGCVWALLHLRYRRPFREAMQWNLRAPWGARAIRTGLGAAVGVIVMGVVLRTPEMQSPMHELLKEPISMALVAVFAVTLGPICEELAFRGLLQPLLVRSLGVAAGILISALPFALLHGPQYAWSWRHVLLITLAGASFGWIRHRSQSTAAAALTHAIYNLVLMSGLIFERQVTN